jgi:hypothetical protein
MIGRYGPKVTASFMPQLRKLWGVAANPVGSFWLQRKKPTSFREFCGDALATLRVSPLLSRL